MVAPVCTGMSGADIYAAVNGGSGAQSIDYASGQAGQAQQLYADAAQTLARVQGGMSAVWTGSASEGATASLGNAVASMNAARDSLTQAQGSLQNQSVAFNGVKNNVVQMAASKPDVPWVDSHLVPWTTDAETAASNWDAQNQANIQWYDRYMQSSSTNAQQLPTTIQAPNAPAPAPAPAPTHSIGAVAGGVAAGTYSGPSGGTVRRSTSTVTGASGGYASSQPYRAPTGGVPVASSGTPMAPGAGTGSVDQATQSAGYSNPGNRGGYPSSSGPGGGFGPIGGGGLDASGGFGPVGGFGPLGSGGAGGGDSAYGGGSGRGYGSGGVSGGGSAAGSGSALGAGNRVGAGGAVEGAAVRGGGAASSAASGGRGASGMGGMGGHGGKGQGGEDEEHQRKFVVPVADPDDIFAGDLPPTVPPVIGE
jgi:hypothetical protein